MHGKRSTIGIERVHFIVPSNYKEKMLTVEMFNLISFLIFIKRQTPFTKIKKKDENQTDHKAV